MPSAEMKALYVMIGLPGSGKDTWLTTPRKSPAMHALISPDSYAWNDGKFFPAKLAGAWRECYARLLKICGAQTSPIAFNATLVTPESRTAIIEIGRHFGYQVVGVFMNTPLEECLRRNRLRKERQPVPESVICKMALALRPPTEPDEFDKVIVIGSGGGS